MASTADWHKAHLGQQLQALLPVLLLGSLALLTYWLVQNSPILAEDTSAQSASVKPNAYFHRFRLVSFGAKGEWEMQLSGHRASHRADIERYDIDAPQLLRRDTQTGAATQVSAQKGRINESGSVVQLYGQAVIQRPAHLGVNGVPSKAFEIRSEYLLLDDDRHALETNQPVVITQGQDRFSAERMLALQQDGKLELNGRVRGTLMPPVKPPVRASQ